MLSEAHDLLPELTVRIKCPGCRLLIDALVKDVAKDLGEMICPKCKSNITFTQRPTTTLPD